MGTPIEPLDTGPRRRRKGPEPAFRRFLRRALRNRHLLLAVLWVARVILSLFGP